MLPVRVSGASQLGDKLMKKNWETANHRGVEIRVQWKVEDGKAHAFYTLPEDRRYRSSGFQKNVTEGFNPLRIPGAMELIADTEQQALSAAVDEIDHFLGPEV